MLKIDPWFMPAIACICTPIFSAEKGTASDKTRRLEITFRTRE